MTHHTKDKGDLGVAKAYADLVGKGYRVLVPMTEHAPFDLVTYRDGAFLRVQVKYRAAVSGAVYVPFKSSWADQYGAHTRRTDKAEVDLFCVYCPDTDECYYLRPQCYAGSVTLRIIPSKNNQRARVWSAADFRTIPPDSPQVHVGPDPPPPAEPPCPGQP
ncbi:group I intron-associated PD-(D/E)XK endonuclease [Nocardioides nitrophenolicus]|uniref:group I intron-associated PD-(D/E)XK endonuclease n=1 Tax=Nocardioides nitrophenolicus TaxID=60489 RepID=UPI00195D6EAF|nr:group I intron-associated PD-(D/E)XK endonuclease [Nocardioides nitrophenolicus]MBM7515906.1 hypothetical protein [Nocardioides nitrophenolicus]